MNLTIALIVGAIIVFALIVLPLVISKKAEKEDKKRIRYEGKKKEKKLPAKSKKIETKKKHQGSFKNSKTKKIIKLF